MSKFQNIFERIRRISASASLYNKGDVLSENLGCRCEGSHKIKNRSDLLAANTTAGTDRKRLESFFVILSKALLGIWKKSFRMEF